MNHYSHCRSRAWPSRRCRLISAEALEARAAPSGGFIEALMGLAFYSPADETPLRSLQDSHEDRTEWIAASRPSHKQLLQIGRNALRFTATSDEPPVVPQKPLQHAEQYQLIMRERMADVLARLFGDQAEMTREDWLLSPAVNQLAESFAASRYTTFEFTVMHNTKPDGFVSSVSTLALEDEVTYGGEGAGENSPPIAYPNEYGARHDFAVFVDAPGVLEDDEDPDYDPLSAVLVSGPAHAASFSLGGDGSVTYMPPANWAGPDQFTYKASDGTDESEEVTVSIMIGNTPVITAQEEYQVLHDTRLDVPAEEGVLANDEDWDGDTFWAELGTGPSYAAEFALNSDGSFTYLPPANWVGSDSFTYFANDGVVGPFGGPSGPVQVWIHTVNNAPAFEPYVESEGEFEAPAGAPLFEDNIIGQMHAEELDPEQETYELDDNPIVTVDATTGIVRLTDAEVFEDMLDNNVMLQIEARATDGVDQDTSPFVMKLFCDSNWFIYLKTQSGSEFLPSNAAELNTYLDAMERGGEKIDTLIIKGHGSSDGIRCGGDGDWLTCEGGNVYIGSDDQTDTLKAVTDKGSQIKLRGCFTRRLADRVQDALDEPGDEDPEVWGAVRFVIGIPGTPWGAGVYQ